MPGKMPSTAELLVAEVRKNERLKAENEKLKRELEALKAALQKLRQKA